MELTTPRSGVVHTIESLLAAILFLFLVVAITQQVRPQGDIGADISLRTRNVVETMDAAGRLRPPLANRSLGIVKDRAEAHLPALDLEVAMRRVNATADTATFSGEHSAAFPVNASAAGSQTARLWFDDAASPNVTVNGVDVLTTTGTVDSYREIDIADETVNGLNHLNISVTGPSTVGYSIDIAEQYRTGVPPSDIDVTVTTYTVGGHNHSFQPAEVSLQAWQ